MTLVVVFLIAVAVFLALLGKSHYSKWSRWAQLTSLFIVGFIVAFKSVRIERKSVRFVKPVVFVDTSRSMYLSKKEVEKIIGEISRTAEIKWFNRWSQIVDYSGRKGVFVISDTSAPDVSLPVFCPSKVVWKVNKGGIKSVEVHSLDENKRVFAVRTRGKVKYLKVNGRKVYSTSGNYFEFEVKGNKNVKIVAVVPNDRVIRDNVFYYAGSEGDVVAVVWGNLSPDVGALRRALESSGFKVVINVRKRKEGILKWRKIYDRCRVLIVGGDADGFEKGFGNKIFGRVRRGGSVIISGGAVVMIDSVLGSVWRAGGTVESPLVCSVVISPDELVSVVPSGSEDLFLKSRFCVELKKGKCIVKNPCAGCVIGTAKIGKGEIFILNGEGWWQWNLAGAIYGVSADSTALFWKSVCSTFKGRYGILPDNPVVGRAVEFVGAKPDKIKTPYGRIKLKSKRFFVPKTAGFYEAVLKFDKLKFAVNEPLDEYPVASEVNLKIKQRLKNIEYLKSAVKNFEEKRIEVYESVKIEPFKLWWIAFLIAGMWIVNFARS